MLILVTLQIQTQFKMLLTLLTTQVVQMLKHHLTQQQVKLKFNLMKLLVRLSFNILEQVHLTTDFGFGAGAADATLGAGGISSEFFTFDGVNPDVDQLRRRLNNIREQIDQLVEDSNYRGVNLLSGDNLRDILQ